MEITGKGTLYKNQYGWSISDNQKQADGTINKFYIPVRFKKDLKEPNDRSYVSIKGFTKPYKTKEDKLSISYFIMDYVEIGNSNNYENKTDTQIIADVVNNTEDLFQEFANENEIDDMSLPF